MNSLDLLTEYENKYGQKALYTTCGVAQPTVSVWKKRGGMTPAATVKLGLELGYPIELLMKIAAVEAERTEAGRNFLMKLAGSLVTHRPTNKNLAERGDSDPIGLQKID